MQEREDSPGLEPEAVEESAEPDIAADTGQTWYYWMNPG